MSVAVYRQYAADGTLLYVGVSANPLRRMSEHNSKSGRRPVRIDLEWFDSLAEALAAERKAIKTEAPRDNVYVPQDPPPKAPANETTAELIRLIDSAAATLGVEPTTIGERAGQGGQFYWRLCNGKRVWPETADKVRDRIAAMTKRVTA